MTNKKKENEKNRYFVENKPKVNIMTINNLKKKCNVVSHMSRDDIYEAGHNFHKTTNTMLIKIIPKSNVLWIFWGGSSGRVKMGWEYGGKSDITPNL